MSRAELLVSSLCRHRAFRYRTVSVQASEKRHDLFLSVLRQVILNEANVFISFSKTWFAVYDLGTFESIWHSIILVNTSIYFKANRVIFMASVCVCARAASFGLG